jgi:hypothetical protein
MRRPGIKRPTKRPRAKSQRCVDCGRLRNRLHVAWQPGTMQWQCSDDKKKCNHLFLERWTKRYR